MTIKEYKDKLIAIVMDMEKEYGCEIQSVNIFGETDVCGPFSTRSYSVDVRF